MPTLRERKSIAYMSTSDSEPEFEIYASRKRMGNKKQLKDRDWKGRDAVKRRKLMIVKKEEAPIAIQKHEPAPICSVVPYFSPTQPTSSVCRPTPPASLPTPSLVPPASVSAPAPSIPTFTANLSSDANALIVALTEQIHAIMTEIKELRHEVQALNEMRTHCSSSASKSRNPSRDHDHFTSLEPGKLKENVEGVEYSGLARHCRKSVRFKSGGGA